MFSNVTEMVICEKYILHHTILNPQQDHRGSVRSHSQYHISKLKKRIILSDKFDKACVTSTADGKTLVSTYLGRNLNNLNIKAIVSIIINSECHLTDSKQTRTNTLSNES